MKRKTITFPLQHFLLRWYSNLSLVISNEVLAVKKHQQKNNSNEQYSDFTNQVQKYYRRLLKLHCCFQKFIFLPIIKQKQFFLIFHSLKCRIFLFYCLVFLYHVLRGYATPPIMNKPPEKLTKDPLWLGSIWVVNWHIL